MRFSLAILAVAAANAVWAGDGAWVAFVRDGNDSTAFERSSIVDTRVNLLRVRPKTMHDGLVIAWDIKTQVHQFDCAARTYKVLTKKMFDERGKLTGDDTHVVMAMNSAFKDRALPVDTETLRKAHALVCAKTEPAPAKPFSSMPEALAWMAN